MGNRGTRFLRNVLKVRKVGMKPSTFHTISSEFSIYQYILQGNSWKLGLSCAKLSSRLASYENCEVIFLLVRLPVRLSSSEVVFLWGHLPIRSFSCVVIFLWGRLPVKSSSCEAVFLGDCLPVRSYSCEVVFLCGGLPLRSSSCEVVFLWGRLPVRSSSISNQSY